MLIIAAAVASAQPIQPVKPIHMFDDWYSVCDNTRKCQVTLQIGMPDSEEIYLRISRGSAGNAMPEVRLDWHSKDPTTQALVIDGIRFAVDKSGRPASGNDFQIARSLADAHTIEVIGDADHVPVSSAGIHAALLDMDARQLRAHTATAIVAVGDLPISTIPKPPERPTIVEVNSSHGPVMKPSRKLLAQWRKASGCPENNNKATYASWPVDTHSAAIIVMCHDGGRNNDALIKVGSRLDGADARDASFDYDASMSETPGPTAAPLNPELDRNTGRMISGANGGITYAGSYEEWVWDGRRFRAIERGSAYGREFTARAVHQ